VYEKDLQKLKVGQTIHFTLTNNPGKEYDADVYAISNTFEAKHQSNCGSCNGKGTNKD
jgi:cobalt-zinc-cadmium efflux system membrane fusion protein